MEPRFREGDKVRVRDEPRPGHIRTPTYIMGKVGVVDRVHGSFGSPEKLAYAQPAENVPLYYVSFDAGHVWGGPRIGGRVIVDIYEHWLEPA